jgi:hypothetical protein
MGLTEIIVLVIVVLFMSGMGVLVYLANSPVKGTLEQSTKKKE